jgi:hypothetical protein
MTKAALRLVESTFYQKEIELWSEETTRDLHSLHQAIATSWGMRPEIGKICVERFSQKGMTVLDPFCGAGAPVLEALLSGRHVVATDTNLLSTRITEAKLDPADLTEVTLALQLVNLRRPVSLETYRQAFNSFYDIDTFREIWNLREFLRNRRDRIGRFIELIAMSLLHGHNAGYFSAYSFPQVSVTPAEQEAMNSRRRQVPDYRSIVPRILRKTAQVLRDSNGSSFRSGRTSASVFRQDPRNLQSVSTGSVDCVITTPPFPSQRNLGSENWLRLWFAGLSAASSQSQSFEDLPAWADFMNEVLFELARVVRSGGRAVLDLREIRMEDTTVQLDRLLKSTVQENLSRFWECEGSLIHQPRIAQVKDTLKSRDESKTLSRNRLLILKRR